MYPDHLSNQTTIHPSFPPRPQGVVGIAFGRGCRPSRGQLAGAQVEASEAALQATTWGAYHHHSLFALVAETGIFCEALGCRASAAILPGVHAGQDTATTESRAGEGGGM